MSLQLIKNDKPYKLPNDKKTREKVSLEAIKLIDDKTGLVYSSNIQPKYEGWTLQDYLDTYMPYIEAMSAEELTGDKLNEYMAEFIIAEKKEDGHRALAVVTEDDVRFFSKRISKVTGWFSENSDTVPHLRDCLHGMALKGLKGTILDTELVTIANGSTSKDVQTITGSKPVNSIYEQVTNIGLGVAVMFDLVHYKGVAITKLPLHYRKLYAFKVFSIISEYTDNIKFSKMYAVQKDYNHLIQLWDKHYMHVLTKSQYEQLKTYVEIIPSYIQLFNNYVEQKYEGIMLKNVHSHYVHRVSRAFVKMKECTTFDVVITGFDPPEKYYGGKELSNPTFTWDYWEDGAKRVNKTLTLKQAERLNYKPLSKFYYYNWIGAIIYGVVKGSKLMEIGKCSGLSEEDRADISSNKGKYLGDVIEVEAQGFSDITKGTLRHPRFLRHRQDKNAEDCTWARHVRN
jgi:ATP-dependent DNA ligase